MTLKPWIFRQGPKCLTLAFKHLLPPYSCLSRLNFRATKRKAILNNIDDGERAAMGGARAAHDTEFSCFPVPGEGCMS